MYMINKREVRNDLVIDQSKNQKNNLQSNNPAKFGLEILITVGDKKKTKLLNFEEGGGGASNFFSSICAPNLISKAPIHEQYL